MRIALVSHKFPPSSVGGTEMYTRHLALALAARHDVAVFFRHDGTGLTSSGDWEPLDDIRAWRIARPVRAIQRSPARLFLDTFANPDVERSFARFLDELRPDLVHFQHVMSLSYRLLAHVKARGLPCLLTLHDYWFVCGNSQLIWPSGQTCRGKALGLNCVRCATAARFPSPLLRGLRPALAPAMVARDGLVKSAARRADRLVAPSQFLIDRYVRAGFPAARFHLLENGIPVEQVRRAGWRPRQGPLRVTFLGSLAWQKGVHVLLEAFSGLPPGAARLRIWGDRATFPEYSARLERLANPPEAQLMGPVPNEQVGEVLGDSDLVVVPSLWYENSPVVIQEARAMGLPVIASGHGALAEKVRDGVDGLTFPPGDVAALRRVLQRLLDEPDLLPRLRRGVRPAQDVADHTAQIEVIYRGLAAAPQDGGR